MGRLTPNATPKTLHHPKFTDVPCESGLWRITLLCPTIASLPSPRDNSHPLSQSVFTCFSPSGEMVTPSLDCGIPASSVSATHLPGFQIGKDRGHGTLLAGTLCLFSLSSHCLATCVCPETMVFCLHCFPFPASPGSYKTDFSYGLFSVPCMSSSMTLCI